MPIGKYSIGEVSKLLGVPVHVLRYWEKEVPLLAPAKGRTGRREYGRRDLQLLFRFRYLVQEKRYTVQGAASRVWEELNGSDQDLRSRIAEIRGELLELWTLARGKVS